MIAAYRRTRRLAALGALVALAGCATPPAGAGGGPAALAGLAPYAARERPAGGATLGGCAAFPADNPWNADVSQLPVDPNSGQYLAHMHAATTNLHPDFGHDPHYGIPVTVVPGSQRFVPMSFADSQQSDPGPYPFPRGVRIEGGAHASGDRHALVVDSGNCRLYETWRTFYRGPGFRAGSGAIFDLSSDRLRPDCYTSADAAGLPIAPALPRYDEVAAGAIHHALRFTVAKTQAAFVHPATHFASSSADPNDPPMGLRVRLKASYDLSHVRGASLVILTALKTYGMFLADNGSDWYVSGSTDTRWNDDDLNQIKSVPASAFEVVELGSIVTHC